MCAACGGGGGGGGGGGAAATGGGGRCLRPLAARPMEALLGLPHELKLEAHLVELESAGFTLIPDAIPTLLLARLRLAHARITARVRRARPEPEWSWESDEPGVVDYFRAYELDPAFEELMDLETVFPVVDAAVRQGRGRAAHPGGARLLSGPVTQHLPAGSRTGQHWHVDGDFLRCTYVLNDLGADGGGTVFLPGSHHMDTDYGYLLNDQKEQHTYPPPREGRFSAPYDRSLHRPHHIPGAYQLVAPAGACLVNWTTVWHTRTANTSTIHRDTIWQVWLDSLASSTRELHALRRSAVPPPAVRACRFTSGRINQSQHGGSAPCTPIASPQPFTARACQPAASARKGRLTPLPSHY
jgi:hypothetical protein